jgi:flagellar hook-associated protein 3 FlgL
MNSRITRVSNNQLTNQIMRNIQDQLSMQDKLFQQISSNKVIEKASDNPVDAGRIMSTKSQIDRNTEFQSTINLGNVWTNVTTTALNSASETWKRVEELGVSAADGTKSASDLEAIAEELDQLLQHLIQVANTENAGNYIFSGGKTKTPPFAFNRDAASGRITGVFYQGDIEERKVRSSENSTVQINALGSSGGDPNKRGVFVDTAQNVHAFDAIIELREKLLQNDVVGISGSGGILEKVEKVGRSITSAAVRIGGAQETLELDSNRLVEESADLEGFLSEIQDTDVAEAILKLNNIQNVYEAALSAGGRLMQTTLINYI